MDLRTVGHYEILEKIGEGGMGVVWKARDQLLGRLTAIKALPPAERGNTSRRERFIQEARTASSLNHPNIVTIHEIVTHEDQEYLVMEYVHGRTLKSLIGQQGLKLAEAVEYAVQIADALSAAHRAGIVHRDVKPSNVMVTEGRRVKVLDFGIAKLIAASTEPGDKTATKDWGQTADGIVVGTMAYMSPEQAEGKAVDARSDTFTFGSLLYEMLTGRQAFEADTQIDTREAIRTKEARPLPTNIPRDVERIVQRCLRKEPDQRWQSTADLKFALEELRDDLQRRTTVPPPAPASLRRRQAIAIPAALAAVIIIAAVLAWRAGWLFGTKSPDPVVVPLTTYQGREVEPSLSPDGTLVAFTWDGPLDPNGGIYVKLIGPGEPLRLTNSPAPHAQPKWSPDGTSIAFLRGQEGPNRFGVYIIPALGGAERKVGDTGGQFIAWYPDGKSLLISRSLVPGQSARLVRLSIDTGNMTALTATAGAQSDEAAVHSPNGQTIAFRRNLGPIGTAQLLTMPSSLTAPAPDAVKDVHIPEQISLLSAAWSADGRDLIYSAGWNPENAALWRVPATGSGTPVRLSFAGDGALAPDVARRGDRLVFSRFLREINIWSLQLDAAGNPVGAPTRAFDSSMSELCPRFSPDGSQVAFESNRSGRDEVWVCRSDGGNCRQITSFGTHAGSPSWSPDGKWIAFDAIGTTGGSVYIVGADGGSPALVTQGQLPRWSGDGKSIYYYTGSPAQLFRIARTGGTPEQLTVDGGNTVEESADRTALYYSKGSAFGRTPLRMMPIGGGAPADILPVISGRNFTVGDAGIWYLIARPTPGSPVLSYNLCFYDFATKTSRVLYQTSQPIHAGLTIDHDHRRILFTQIDRTGNDLMLIDHFR